MVETQHPTESLGAGDGVGGRSGVLVRLDQSIVDALVIPLPMVMSGVLASCLPKRPFTKEDHPIETRVLDRPDESLGIGVEIGRAVGESDDFDAGILQEVPERQRELGVSVENQEALSRPRTDSAQFQRSQCDVSPARSRSTRST